MGKQKYIEAKRGWDQWPASWKRDKTRKVKKKSLKSKHGLAHLLSPWHVCITARELKLFYEIGFALGKWLKAHINFV